MSIFLTQAFVSIRRRIPLLVINECIRQWHVQMHVLVHVDHPAVCSHVYKEYILFFFCFFLFF